MKKSKNLILLVTATVVFYIILNPKHAQAATEISADIDTPTTWTKANSPYIVQTFIRVNAPLSIEPGVVVKFKNLSIAGLGIGNVFRAVGTPTEPIVFTSACDYSYGGETTSYCSYRSPLKGDWTGLSVYPQYRQPATLEYVKIFYANNGIWHEINDPFNPYKNYLSVKHSEIRYCYGAGIFLRHTQPILDDLTLANNYSGLEVFDASFDWPTKIRNSAIFDNGNGVSGSGAGRNSVPVDARYNWWGNSSGPYRVYGTKEDNPHGTGNRIVGTGVLFRPWDENDPTVPSEPVIFIPGIGASLNPDLMISGVLADNWTMFDHTYDGIISAFKAMGYVEGQTLFIAYYDWRKSNADSAKNYLKPLIQEALAKSDANSVNIVTHSMGSLVARSYVESADYVPNVVDNLIMIAPPNRGSSDVYTAWEGGYIPKNWATRTPMYAYLDYLSIKKLTFNTYDTIHKFIPSLKELMPTYNYLQPAGGSLKNYQAMHEQNTFLQNLSTDTDILKERTRLSLILGDNQDTVNKIPVIDSDDASIWQDGKPNPIDPEKNDAKGDGEVLLASGEMANDFRDVLLSDHREIVSRSEKIVAERLKKNLADIFDAPEITDELTIWTDAPADLAVDEPGEGGTVSRDNEGITDARYAEEKNKDGFKIISIPNPKSGDYHVRLHGNSNGTGKYHVGVEYTNHDSESEDQSKSIEVAVKADEPQEFVVPSDPQNPTAPIEEITKIDITEPVLTVTSPVNGKEYGRNEKITIQYTVSDDMSKTEDIFVEKYLDDSNDMLESDTLDLKEMDLGEHALWMYATDEAGNSTGQDIYFTVVESSSVESEPEPILEPTPDLAPDSTPTPTPNLTADLAPDPANTENSAKKKHYKQRDRNKDKKKTATKKAVPKNGVKKYKGEIKIASSTNSLPAEPLSVEDVFGIKPEWNIEADLTEPIKAVADANKSKALEIAKNIASEAQKKIITKEASLSVFDPKIGTTKFASSSDFFKLNLNSRVAGVSTIKTRSKSNQKLNYPFWGALGIFLMLFVHRVSGKLKRPFVRIFRINT